MATSKARQKATAKYMKKAYDRTGIFSIKGKKEAWKWHAEHLNLSLNAFILQAVDEKMENIFQTLTAEEKETLSKALNQTETAEEE